MLFRGNHNQSLCEAFRSAGVQRRTLAHEISGSNKPLENFSKKVKYSVTSIFLNSCEFCTGQNVYKPTNLRKKKTNSEIGNLLL